MTLKLYYGPRVYLVSVPAIHDRDGDFHHDLELFLKEEGYVWNSDARSVGDLVPEIAGRLCYLSFKNPRPGGNKAYLQHILESGHGSVLEHSNFGFIFTQISRTLSHELIRHRVGLSYSQLSQRYVDESDVGFVVSVDLQLEVKMAFATMALHKNTAIGIIESAKNNSHPWSGIPEEERMGWGWLSTVEKCLNEYKMQAEYLMNREMKKLIDSKPEIKTIGYTSGGYGQDTINTTQEERTALRKQARQAARSVLPNCTETKIFVTGNTRAFRHFIEQRGSKHAEPEIRRLAYEVWQVLNKEAPNLFSDYEWTLGGEYDSVKKQYTTPLDVSTPYRKV